MKTPQQPSKHTKLCWPFSSWQTTTIQQISITISTDCPCCQSGSPQRWPRLTAKPRTLSSLRNFSDRASDFTMELNGDDRTNYIHSLMRGDPLQTDDINGPSPENLGDIPAVFRKIYVKSQSMATAKHKFQKFVSNPANQKIVKILDELQNWRTTHST